MPICLKCSQKSNQIGESCPSCGKCFMVRDEHGDDPLNLLGSLVAGKFVPISVFLKDKCTIAYEIWQNTVDRLLTMCVVNPDYMKQPGISNLFQTIVEQMVSVHQPNILALMDVFEIPGIHTTAVTFEAKKGKTFSEILQAGAVDQVTLMHIFHQILQAFSACHIKGLTFPDFNFDNVLVMRSGGDAAFVKIFGLFNALMKWGNEPHSPLDDVHRIGQLALACITGKPLPIEPANVELAPEMAFMAPIVQIFLRAIAPEEQRFQSCVELLHAFEAAFELNTRAPESNMPNHSDRPKRSVTLQVRSPLSLEQVVWMHRPPQRQN